MRKSIGKEAAIERYNSGWWEGVPPRAICELQLFTQELCMPFDEFHSAMEEALGRPVYLHEFGLNYDRLVKEFLGEKPAPSLDQIIELIPADKRVVVVIK